MITVLEKCGSVLIFQIGWEVGTTCEPAGYAAAGFEYHNGNGTLCLIGTFDEQTGTFHEESNQSIDYGIDFYAPQTVLTPDGRRIMMGWMQNWDTCTNAVA